jgi:hypothetical protein
MIYYFTRFYRGTIQGFIESWAPPLRHIVRVVRYRETLLSNPEPRGVYVFADLERLRSWENYLAKRMARRLQGKSPPEFILNDAGNYLGKFQLLKKLHAAGINRFQVYRLEELEGQGKPTFPVFLRRDDDHRGSIGGLLNSEKELEAVLAKLSLRDRLAKKQLMVEEYCNCLDGDGLFRKYSAMNIGGTLIPSHVYFSKGWLTKSPDFVSDASAAEEAEFVNTFPHQTQIAEVFRLAGLQYGRVDYGVKDGKVQIWEINTNPIITRPREIIDPRRIPSQSESARMIAEAFQNCSRTAAVS